jgi:molybdopterin converting factor small subunit
MSITVNFPAALQPLVGHTVTVHDVVATVGDLLMALDRSTPGLAAQLDDPLYNIAVNDELLLHNVDRHPVADGDVVEIVPTMAGG